jgi:Cutinase
LGDQCKIDLTRRTLLVRATSLGRRGRIALGAIVAAGLTGGVVGVATASGAHPAPAPAAAVRPDQHGATDDAATRAAAARQQLEQAAAARRKAIQAARDKAKAAREKAAKQAGQRPSLPVLPGLPALPGRPGAGTPSAPAAGPAACTAYAFLAARGTGEPQGNEALVLKPVFDKVAAGVPGGSNYNVVYPATSDFANGPRQGAADINRFLAAQVQACPNQKFVLSGYSQGAMAVAQATASMPAATRAKVAAIVVFGDPYYRPNQPWDAATNAASPGGLAAAANGLSAFPQFAGKIQDYCNANDSVCGSGSGINGHLSYGQNATAAANFVIGKLR